MINMPPQLLKSFKNLIIIHKMEQSLGLSALEEKHLIKHWPQWERTVSAPATDCTQLHGGLSELPSSARGHPAVPPAPQASASLTRPALGDGVLSSKDLVGVSGRAVLHQWRCIVDSVVLSQLIIFHSVTLLPPIRYCIHCCIPSKASAHSYPISLCQLYQSIYKG